MIPRIKTVTIKNYKSIAGESVNLEPFTILVGHNGSGKSNFIDALSFVHDCLAGSIESAFKNRGGINAVRRRSGGHPTNIGIRITMELEEQMTADYAFEIATRKAEKFFIKQEQCLIKNNKGESKQFLIKEGGFEVGIPGISPKIAPDRLALYAGSATPEFRSVYDFLNSMQFYSIVPVRLRELQDPDSGDHLKSDGSNAAAVLKRVKDELSTEQYDRICRLLSKAVEGVEKVEYKPVGQKETIQFKLDVGLKDPWTFDALNMSDGTLRILGLLLAVNQPGYQPVIAIEEPEATVHPAVTELIVEILVSASKERQILLTTHSPDLLDYKGIQDSQIKVVTMEKGKSLISDLAKSSREAIKQHLYTAGELLRLDELNPDLKQAEKAAAQQDLFPQFNNVKR